MVELKNFHTLKTFFLTKKLEELQKGEQIMEEELNKKTPSELESELQQAKNALNIKKVVELNEQIKKIKAQENEEPKSTPLATDEENVTPPLTLQEARKNLEYALLKEYLSTKDKQEVETFLNSQILMEQNLKERLEKKFLNKE